MGTIAMIIISTIAIAGTFAFDAAIRLWDIQDRRNREHKKRGPQSIKTAITTGSVNAETAGRIGYEMFFFDAKRRSELEIRYREAQYAINRSYARALRYGIIDGEYGSVAEKTK